MAVEVRDALCLSVTDPSQIGEARRAAAALAARLGFSEQKCGEVAIVVSEAATNAARHAKGGEIILRPVQRGSALGVEMLAIDRGPGIASPTYALRDGYSTGGTQGTGLGAIRRLSTEFDLFTNSDPSKVGVGTVILSRVWNAPSVPPFDNGLEVGVVCLPLAGEEACGDHWAIIPDGGRVTVVVADGLGHGVQAAEASRRAILSGQENVVQDPGRMMEGMHAALRSTRGAAVAIFELKQSAGTVQYVGVGNISSVIVADNNTTRSLMSQNGTIGVEARRIQALPYSWLPGATLVMHSDGLATQWQLSRYPGLLNRDPSVIAGVLYRDHRRVCDDVTVLVVRQAPRRTTP